MTTGWSKAYATPVQTDQTVFFAPVTLIQTDYASQLYQRKSPIWHNEDLWRVIMNFLESKSLLRLALTNRNFHKMAMEESLWKMRCSKELGIPDSSEPNFSWRSLYAAAIDGSHSYSLRNCKAHIDWMRVGTFRIESGEVLATNISCGLKDTADVDKKEQPKSLFAISNVKNGPWIADLHFLRCSVCNDISCEGTMQTLEARHWELFLDNKYTTGDWKFEEVMTYNVPYHTPRAAAGIFDKQRFHSKETSDLLNLNLWNSAPGDWQPRGKISKYAVASGTPLQQNDGLKANFSVLRAGSEGVVLAIRVTQQLL